MSSPAERCLRQQFSVCATSTRSTLCDANTRDAVEPPCLVHTTPQQRERAEVKNTSTTTQPIVPAPTLPIFPGHLFRSDCLFQKKLCKSPCGLLFCRLFCSARVRRDERLLWNLFRLVHHSLCLKALTCQAAPKRKNPKAPVRSREDCGSRKREPRSAGGHSLCAL